MARKQLLQLCIIDLFKFSVIDVERLIGKISTVRKNKHCNLIITLFSDWELE